MVNVNELRKSWRMTVSWLIDMAVIDDDDEPLIQSTKARIYR